MRQLAVGEPLAGWRRYGKFEYRSILDGESVRDSSRDSQDVKLLVGPPTIYSVPGTLFIRIHQQRTRVGKALQGHYHQVFERQPSAASNRAPFLHPV